MSDSISDSDWIKVNPERRYRLRRESTPDGRRLVRVVIVQVSEDRRSWSTKRIDMRAELPDTDTAAALVLKEDKIMQDALVAGLNGHVQAAPSASVTDTVLGMLRLKPGTIQ